ITVGVSDGNSISVTTDGAEIIGENLAVKAAEIFLKKIDKLAKVDILLKKNIPLLSGMAGGSTDAAAVLKCLNKLFLEPLGEDDLSELALKLGADVPFCIKGGTALAEGIGEKLSPINFIGDYEVILIKHHLKGSTGEMYKRLDNRQIIPECTTGIFLNKMLSRELENGSYISVNSFAAVSDDFAEQTEICRFLLSNGAFLSGLSGSGPTLFGLFKKTDSKLINTLKEKYKEVYLSKTSPYGIKIVE
ncbi:MAG: 4-(cytidine 5'-diphospho)-2-C-methyl-D-erythritol kinase, partial [Acutalibacteraceae bacterium]|nr:4-(cytidine 5'-diphospho)-2-C-methyl-D-erythritol kinase [Acutalibacteraceae bacterium]